MRAAILVEAIDRPAAARLRSARRRTPADDLPRTVMNEKPPPGSANTHPSLGQPRRRAAAGEERRAVVLVDDERLVQAEPSGDTLNVRSSSPIRPISARPEKPLCRSSESTSAAVSLFIV